MDADQILCFLSILTLSLAKHKRNILLPLRVLLFCSEVNDSLNDITIVAIIYYLVYYLVLIATSVWDNRA